LESGPKESGPKESGPKESGPDPEADAGGAYGHDEEPVSSESAGAYQRDHHSGEGQGRGFAQSRSSLSGIEEENE